MSVEKDLSVYFNFWEVWKSNVYLSILLFRFNRLDNSRIQVAYRAGDVVYKAGDRAQNMYFIVAGRVAIRPERQGAKDVRGLAGVETMLASVLETGENAEESDMENGAEDRTFAADVGTWIACDGQIFGAPW